MDIEIIHNKAKDKLATLILAHGAGAAMDSDWMKQLSSDLSELNIEVIRFNFFYMNRRKLEGRKFPPDRKDKLILCWQQMLDTYSKHSPLFIGGKSMGGRIATLCLQDSAARGCIAYGFPFHPPGKPEKSRLDSFDGVSKPVLVLQGDRDTLGSKLEIASFNLPKTTHVKYLPDGDHSFKPRVKSGHTLNQHIATAAEETKKFIEKYI